MQNNLVGSRSKIILQIDEFAFDNYSKEALYWMGFICCDSSISYNDKRYSFSLELAEKDESHLHKLNKFLKSNRVLYKRTRKRREKEQTSVCLKVSSKYMISRFIQDGLVNKKPNRIPSSNLTNSKDFWRGVLDADGCLQVILSDDRKYPNVTLSSSEKICQKFAEFIEKLLSYNKFYFKKSKESQKWDIKIGGTKAYELIKILYGENNVSLDRKQEKCNVILSSFKEKYAKQT